jgi:uncharacterized protein YdaU (DUF1376 family)
METAGSRHPADSETLGTTTKRNSNIVAAPVGNNKRKAIASDAPSYFKFHIGDYERDTGDLTMLEHGAYTGLMRMYYARGGPLPNDLARLIRYCGGSNNAASKRAVMTVLERYFHLSEDGKHWLQKRCDLELADWYDSTGKRRAAAQSAWAERRGNGIECENRIGVEQKSNLTKSEKSNEISMSIDASAMQMHTEPEPEPEPKNSKSVAETSASAAPAPVPEKPKKQKRTAIRRTIPDGWKPEKKTSADLKEQFDLTPADVAMYWRRFTEYCVLNAKKYTDFDLAFRRCVRDDWGYLRRDGKLPSMQADNE